MKKNTSCVMFQQEKRACTAHFMWGCPGKKYSPRVLRVYYGDPDKPDNTQFPCLPGSMPSAGNVCPLKGWLRLVVVDVCICRPFLLTMDRPFEQDRRTQASVSHLYFRGDRARSNRKTTNGVDTQALQTRTSWQWIWAPPLPPAMNKTIYSHASNFLSS